MTATWHIAIAPTVPLYCRAAPAQSAEDFSSAVSSTMSTHIVLVLACTEVRGGPVRGGILQPPVVNSGAAKHGAPGPQRLRDIPSSSTACSTPSGFFP